MRLWEHLVGICMQGAFFTWLFLFDLIFHFENCSWRGAAVGRYYVGCFIACDPSLVHASMSCLYIINMANRRIMRGTFKHVRGLPKTDPNLVK